LVLGYVLRKISTLKINNEREKNTLHTTYY